MSKVGQTVTISKRFTEKEVAQFSLISMDKNLIHLDKEYAKTTRFGKRIVQGPLLDAMIGGLLGSQLPGIGTIYLSHETQFKKPVYIDELVTIYIRVEHIRHEKNIITLRKWVEKEDKTIAMEGKSIVMDLKDKL
ncbi:MAG: MaoC family dehydratase [Crocinitomicaceae bacterium]|nr:MaoC family dehydratase [Crocinitomicaceae bacterium]